MISPEVEIVVAILYTLVVFLFGYMLGKKPSKEVVSTDTKQEEPSVVVVPKKSKK